MCPYVCVTYDVLCMHLVPVTIKKILSLLVLWSVWVAELIIRYFVCSYLASLYRLYVGMVSRAMLKFVRVVGLFTHNIAT